MDRKRKPKRFTRSLCHRCPVAERIDDIIVRKERKKKLKGGERK